MKHLKSFNWVGFLLIQYFKDTLRNKRPTYSFYFNKINYHPIIFETFCSILRFKKKKNFGNKERYNLESFSKLLGVEGLGLGILGLGLLT